MQSSCRFLLQVGTAWLEDQRSDPLPTLQFTCSSQLAAQQPGRAMLTAPGAAASPEGHCVLLATRRF